jgi:hypothetical protein
VQQEHIGGTVLQPCKLGTGGWYQIPRQLWGKLVIYKGLIDTHKAGPRQVDSNAAPFASLEVT